MIARFFNALLTVAMILLAVMGVWTVGPMLETAFFPVMEKLVIKEAKAYTEDASIMYVEFRKLRACEYVGLSWYDGFRDDNARRVNFAILRDTDDVSIINRPVGAHVAGPWVAGVPVERLREESFVDAIHDCHPFWHTRTEIYP